MFASIKKYFSKRKYREEVRVSMSYLLGFKSDIVEAIGQRYPGTRAAIDTHFFNGVSSMESAFMVLTTVIAAEIEHLNESSKKAYMDLLVGDNIKYTNINRVEQLVWLSRTLLAQTDMQQRAGTLSDDQYDRAVREFVGAARGFDADERFKQGLIAAVDKHLLGGSISI